jgi:hypothetical protein
MSVIQARVGIPAPLSTSASGRAIAGVTANAPLPVFTS